MSRRVVVIGAGASGTAAAYAASKLGARVTLITGRPGATSLSSGALDGDWEGAGDEAQAFIDAIGIWAWRPVRACFDLLEAEIFRFWISRKSGQDSSQWST